MNKNYTKERIEAGMDGLEDGSLRFVEQPTKGDGKRYFAIVSVKPTGPKRYATTFFPNGTFRCSCMAGLMRAEQVPCKHAGAIASEIIG